MAVPISHKIKKFRFKLIFILVCFITLYYYYEQAPKSSVLVPSSSKPLDSPSNYERLEPILDHEEDISESLKGAANEEPKGQPGRLEDEVKTAPLDPKTTHSIKPVQKGTAISARPPKHTKVTKRLPRLPPPKIVDEAFKSPAFMPQRGDSLAVFEKYSDEEYEKYEIMFSEGSNTRLNSKKKQELLPRLSKLPRKPKFPVDTITSLPKADFQKQMPKIQADQFYKETAAEKATRLERLEMVKKTFLISWNQYKRFAWGRDEIRPVTKKAFDPFAGWAATLVDALDTLLIMGLKKEFDEAIEVVKTIDFSRTFRKDIPLFETVIRYLGGLLAAYDLSNEKVLLDKAIELGDNLMGAFDTPNHMPMVSFIWTEASQKYKFRASSSSSFAEIGSLSVEFTRLAQLTGNSTYFDAINRITDAIYELAPKNDIPYLFTQYLDASGCDTVRLTPNDQSSSESLSVAQKPISGTKDREIVKSDKSDKPKLADKDALKPPATTSQIPVNEESSLKQDMMRDRIGKEHKQKVSENPEIIPEEGSEGHVGMTEESLKAYKKKILEAAESDLQKRDLNSENTDTQSIKPIIKTFGPGRSGIVGCRETGPLSPGTSTVRKYTLGGLTDSAYEYYVKEYLLLNGADGRYKELHTKMIDAVNENLLFRPLAEGDPDILFVGNRIKLSPTFFQEDNEVSHLACFAGGMYALGSKVFNRPNDLETAAKLTEGCIWAYGATRSGVMPESFHVRRCPAKLSTETKAPPCHFDFQTVAEASDNRELLVIDDMTNTGALPATSHFSLSTQNFMPGTEVVADGMGGTRWPVNGYDMPRSFIRMDPRYLLRPEALESVFYMYRISGDKKWQDQGWKMFESIIKMTQVVENQEDENKVVGFSAVYDVTDTASEYGKNLRDESESFWMAETLKYAYLLFAEPELVSLDKFVFNTEAHPMLRPKSQPSK